MNERKADIEAIKEKLSSIGSSDDGRTGWDDLADLTEMAQYDIPALIADLESAEALAQRFEDALGEAQRECLESDAELEKLEAEVEWMQHALEIKGALEKR